VAAAERVAVARNAASPGGGWSSALDGSRVSVPALERLIDHASVGQSAAFTAQ
jgi:hypothetical protein